MGKLKRNTKLIDDEIIVKPIKPSEVAWSERLFQYPKLLKAVKNLKIGQAIEINVANPGLIQSIRTKCYKEVKGNYRIRGKVLPRMGISYIMKTDK